MIQFQVNNNRVAFDGPVDTPLLWVLRDHLGLTGTKFGCGIGRCGACTVHIGGAALTACTVRVGALAGARVTTIEGLAPAPGSGQGSLHPVQQAWIEDDVPQCGYCQPGQIMAAVDLLSRLPDPSDGDIDRHMTNLCRCGTYVRIRKAIHRAAALLAETSS
jgi:isoquinoline 1-oxidoreductase alpha subunit